MKTKPFFSLTLSFLLLLSNIHQNGGQIVWLSRYHTFILSFSLFHSYMDRTKSTNPNTHTQYIHINEKVLKDNVSSSQLSQFTFCHSFDPIIFSFDPFIGLPFFIQLPCKMVLESFQIFIFVLWMWCCLNVIAFHLMRHM